MPFAVGEQEEEGDEEEQRLEERGAGGQQESADRLGRLAAGAGQALEELVRLRDRLHQPADQLLGRVGEAAHQPPDPVAGQGLAEPLHAGQGLADQPGAQPAQREQDRQHEGEGEDGRGQPPAAAEQAREPVHPALERGGEDRRQGERRPERQRQRCHQGHGQEQQEDEQPLGVDLRSHGTPPIRS